MAEAVALAVALAAGVGVTAATGGVGGAAAGGAGGLEERDDGETHHEGLRRVGAEYEDAGAWTRGTWPVASEMRSPTVRECGQEGACSG